MIIREVTLKDMPKVIVAIESYSKELEGYGRSFDAESTQQSFKRFVEDDNVSALIAEEDKNIVGMCGIITVPFITDSSSIRAYEFMWHSDPKLSAYKRYKIQIKLLIEMERIAKEKNVKSITISTNSENTMSGYLMKQGYIILELSMVKEV